MVRKVGDRSFIGISQAKTQLSRLAENRETTTLLRRNKPVMALVPIEELNELLMVRNALNDPAILDRLIVAAEKARRTPLEQLRTVGDLLDLANAHLPQRATASKHSGTRIAAD